MARTKRQKAHNKGRQSEKLAAIWLRLKGYRIHELRAKTPLGEVDLIAEKKGVLCFIEVKARASQRMALNAVTSGASRRIEQAAAYWAARHTDLGSNGWRYDIIAIVPGKWPCHIRDAWRPQA